MFVKLSRDMENDLVIIAKTKLDELDADGARNQLIEAHEGAIRKAANKLCAALGRRDLIEEFIQEGRFALNRAIDQFEPYSEWNIVTQQDETARLWTYAYPSKRGAVRGAMWDYLGKLGSGGIRGLDHQLSLARKVQRVHDELMRRAQGEKPTPEEIANESKLSVGEVERALILVGFKPISLDAPSTPDEEHEPTVQLYATEPSPSEQAEWRERFQDLCRAIDHLRDPGYEGRYERKLKVFILHHFKGLDVGVIAREHDIPRGTVSNDLFRIRDKLQALLTHPPDESLTHYQAGDATEIDSHLRYCRYCSQRHLAFQGVSVTTRQE